MLWAVVFMVLRLIRVWMLRLWESLLRRVRRLLRVVIRVFLSLLLLWRVSLMVVL